MQGTIQRQRTLTFLVALLAVARRLVHAACTILSPQTSSTMPTDFQSLLNTLADGDESDDPSTEDTHDVSVASLQALQQVTGTALP